MKIISFVAVFIVAILISPLSGLSQTFTSELQKDITVSGKEKFGAHNATIIFSKENLQVTIKFQGLSHPDTYDLKYFRSRSIEDGIMTLYNIDDNPFFEALFVFEYQSVHKSSKFPYSYSYNFVFVKTNKDGSTNHSTSFFCNKVKEKELALKERELNMKDSERAVQKSAIPKKADITSTTSTKKYILIRKDKVIPGNINSSDISKLSEPLLAVAAFYSGLGGTNCTGKECDLTTALGLGKQGSTAHKNIIAKWLPNDKVAKQLIAQDCYQRPSGASSFSDYEYLTLEQSGDTIVVNYSLMYWNTGNSKFFNGPDKYLIKGKTLSTLNRNIWKEF